MKELIQHIAQALVDNPDQVIVNEITTQQSLILELKVAKEDLGNEITTQQSLILELKVAKEDLGKVIGKKGRTAQAMRTILLCASAKTQKKAILEIVE